jgi:hypothetical protein
LAYYNIDRMVLNGYSFYYAYVLEGLFKYVDSLQVIVEKRISVEINKYRKIEKIIDSYE